MGGFFKKLANKFEKFVNEIKQNENEDQKIKEKKVAKEEKETKEVKEQKPFTLWDNRDKPLEWFFSDDAKTIYEECLANSNIMWETLMDFGKKEGSETGTPFDGMKPVFLSTCSRIMPDKLEKTWLIVFYSEFLITKYNHLSMDIQFGKLHYPLFLLMMVADLRCEDDEKKYYLPYPDCLTEEKNPVLYYMSRAIKESILFDIIADYVFRAFYKGKIDVSKEEWMYDKSLFVNGLGTMKSADTIVEIIKAKAEHPEYLVQ